MNRLIPPLAGFLTTFAPIQCSEAEREQFHHRSEPIEYTIVVTGDEILEGVYPDAHTYFLTRTLKPLGFHCLGSLSVNDRSKDLQTALEFAARQASVTILTGGLGPTSNDITRETVAEFTGIPLQEDPAAISELEKRFNQTRDQLRPNLRRQTLTPVRGRFLRNTIGTAVGLVYDSDDSLIIALPGPPRELQPMVKEELLPFFKERFGLRSLGCSVTLRFAGIGQSLIDQTIRDELSIAQDVTITSLFQGTRVDFTFSLPTDSDRNRQRLAELKGAITAKLRGYIYSDGASSLEEAAITTLRSRGDSLALVEIGTEGNLAATLRKSPSASGFVTEAISAPSPARMSNLLKMSAELRSSTGCDSLKATGRAALRLMANDLVIVVGPLESDSKGSQFLRMALGTKKDQWNIAQLPIRTNPEMIDPDTITRILDWLRKQTK